MGGGDSNSTSHVVTAASFFFLGAAAVTTFVVYDRKHKKVDAFLGRGGAVRVDRPRAPPGHVPPVKYKSVKESPLLNQLNIHDLECAHIHQVTSFPFPQVQHKPTLPPPPPTPQPTRPTCSKSRTWAERLRARTSKTFRK